MPALLLPVAAVIAATEPATNPSACTANPLLQTRSSTPPGVRPLGDMPDGYLMRAVIVRVGPCSLRLVREPSGFSRGVWRYELDGAAAAKATPADGR